MEIIELTNVKKDFKKAIRQQGLWGMFKSLFSFKYEIKSAVKGISFKVNEGEIVGYIGANGAGKSTTIKMMCGILTPTSGNVLIKGKTPYNPADRKLILNDIGVVFGQRTQLWWDLPVIESLNVLKEIYLINEIDYKERLNFLKEVLGLEEFLSQPVRTLSLGQRMRADLAASLIHNPKILFLDEPTIGLDVLVKDKVINAIKLIHEKYNTTILLTTHNMDDITDLCNRIIILDEGSIIFDGPIQQIKKKFGNVKTISLVYKDTLNLDNLKEIFKEKIEVKLDNGYIFLSFDDEKISTKEVLKYLIEYTDIKDINIQESSLESIVRTIYENKKY